MFGLTAHLTSSVGWVGSVGAYPALGGSAVTSQDAQTVRAAWTAMELTGRIVIVPLVLTVLLTALVMSLGNPWGACSGTDRRCTDYLAHPRQVSVARTSGVPRIQGGWRQ